MQHNFKRWFGQNFLTDIPTILRFIETLDIKDGDTILEIGPGNGALTDFLIQYTENVTVVEIDDELIEMLSNTYGEAGVEIIHTDILEFDEVEHFKDTPYKIISSLPYNIAKKIVNKFLTSEHPPELMSVMMQKEVAEDYASLPPKSAFIGTVARLHADIEYMFTVNKDLFFPEPKVDGGIVKYTNIVSESDRKLEKFIKVGFSSPRKKLSKNLENVGHDKSQIEELLQEMDLTVSARAQELSLENWKTLYKALND